MPIPIDPQDPEAVATAVLQAAERHGQDSEPDMEVGDLQEALRLAIDAMTPDQRQGYLVRLREESGFYDTWGPEAE